MNKSWRNPLLLVVSTLLAGLLLGCLWAAAQAGQPAAAGLGLDTLDWAALGQDARDLQAYDPAAPLDSPPHQHGPGVIFVVGTTVPDINPDGLCSLIEALENANDDAATHADCPAGSGPDTIQLAPGASYTLTVVHNSVDGDSGLPVVVSDITIDGNGATIARSTAAGTPPFRVAAVGLGGALTLDSITISHGYGLDQGGAGIFNAHGSLTVMQSTVRDNVTEGDRMNGGGIYVLGPQATLVLSRSQVISNVAAYGGGISTRNFVTGLIASSVISGNAVSAPLNSGGGGVNSFYGNAVTIIDSTISHNVASGSAANTSDGGGIVNEGSTMHVINSTISHNKAMPDYPMTLPGLGGGIWNLGEVGITTTLLITNSQIISNEASFAGGLASTGSAIGPVTTRMKGAEISGNVAASGGIDTDAGGIFNGSWSVMTIVETDIRHNFTDGGSISQNGNGGGILNQQATLTLVRSTVSDNEATGTADRSGNGGGIFNLDSRLTIVNCTVSNNTASGGITSTVRGLGGGIANSNAFGGSSIITITNSTIAGNEANVAGGGLATVSLSGASLTTVAENSIVAGNIAPANSGCLNDGGVIVSQGHNLEDGDTCEFDQPSDILNADPLLGPLQDNGGPTLTHALLPFSPAIDAANDATCAAPPVNGVDQRGVARPVGHGCDIGAYESAAVGLNADLTLEMSAVPGQVPIGGYLTFILTATNEGTDTSYGIGLAATLPELSTYITSTTSAGSCSAAGGSVTCALGNLESAGTVTVMVTVRAAAVGQAQSTAAVGASTHDLLPDNNNAQATSMIEEAELFLPVIFKLP